MKYLIVSDIHGVLSTLEQVLDFYQKNRCDMLCILGDVLNYGPRHEVPEGINAKGVAQRLNGMADQIVAVRGNHGHIYNEQHFPKGHHDFFFYGHTHLWKLEQTEQTVVCNTGSITLPKGGNEPTFAVYEDGSVTVYRLDGTPLKHLSQSF